MNLEQLIPLHYARKHEELDQESRSVFEAFLSSMNTGEIRAAENVDGNWRVNAWVKQGILLSWGLWWISQLTPNSNSVTKTLSLSRTWRDSHIQFAWFPEVPRCELECTLGKTSL
jgi:hypothetical protein